MLLIYSNFSLKWNWMRSGASGRWLQDCSRQKVRSQCAPGGSERAPRHSVCGRADSHSPQDLSPARACYINLNPDNKAATARAFVKFHNDILRAPTVGGVLAAKSQCPTASRAHVACGMAMRPKPRTSSARATWSTTRASSALQGTRIWQRVQSRAHRAQGLHGQRQEQAVHYRVQESG